MRTTDQNHLWRSAGYKKMNKRKILMQGHKIYSNVVYNLPYGYAPLPPVIIWNITMKCNLRCVMCPFYGNHAIPINTNDELNFIQIKNIISGIKKDYRKFPYLPFIGITGGEPFSRDDMLSIFAYLKEKGFNFSVTTNFSLVNKDKIKRLLKIGVSDIRISLDGPEEIHNRIRRRPVFTKIIENIKYVKSINPKMPIKLNCTISRYNFGHLGYMVELAKELGSDLSFQYVQFLDKHHVDLHKKVITQLLGDNYPTKVDVDSFNEEEIDFLVSEISQVKRLATEKKVNIYFTPELKMEEIKPYFLDLEGYRHSNKCLFPASSARIDSQGFMFPCVDYLYGNLKEKRFAEIWNNSRARKFRKTLKKAKLFPGCIRCCKI